MNIVYKTKDGKEFNKEMDALNHEMSLNKNNDINATQLLVFELIKKMSFNGLDGEHVVNYLTKNKDKWTGVIFSIDSCALRDIEDDFFNADTILVYCNDNETAKSFISLLKRNLVPDEIGIEDLDFNLKKCVIRMWWD